MNVYDFAMEMERDGEKYYRTAATRAGHQGIRNILIRLADAEVTHFHIFEQLKKNEKVVVGDPSLLVGVKNIFAAMAESGDSSLIKQSEVETYRGAQEIEQKSIDFYQTNAGAVADEYQREVFLKVAEEEKKHYLILDRIIEFVLRPQQWLESAESYHLEDY